MLVTLMIQMKLLDTNRGEVWSLTFSQVWSHSYFVSFFPVAQVVDAPQGISTWKHAREKGNSIMFRTTNVSLLEKCDFLPAPFEQG